MTLLCSEVEVVVIRDKDLSLYVVDIQNMYAHCHHS